MPRPEFGGYALSDPRLTRLLHRIDQHAAQVEAALAALAIRRQEEAQGPQRCCAEHGTVTDTVGTCPICGRTWEVTV